METEIKQQVTTLLGDYGWMFIAGMIMLLFRSTIENAVAGLMVFIGPDYDEDDVIELDGKPGRIVRVGLWKTVFFIYHVVDGNIVSGDKLVVQNDKLKDMKISKNLLEKNSKRILYKQLSTNSEVAKISVIGMGMMSQSGVAEKMFQTLADQQINILAISTSEIKISVLIEKKYTENALNSLHSAYRLGINN